jgi:hypothetical protein
LTKRIPGRETRNHFGLIVREGPKQGLRIDRTRYAAVNKNSSHHFPRELDPILWDSQANCFEDEDHRKYTDEWCQRQQQNALKNFDLNMAKYRDLIQEEFDEALHFAIRETPSMVEIIDLSEWAEGSVVYIMVLDDYKQLYVGIARGEGGLKKRIRQHWSGNKQFDRLLHGSVETSKISIDSFRALDTTRIFAMRHNNPAKVENKILELIPSRFVLNRIAGGSPTSPNELEKLVLRRALFVAIEGTPGQGED